MRDSKRDTDVQNGLLDSVGEGEGRMIWENGIETCIVKLQYFGHLMRRVDSLEKTLMLGGIGGRRRRG